MRRKIVGYISILMIFIALMTLPSILIKNIGVKEFQYLFKPLIYITIAISSYFLIRKNHEVTNFNKKSLKQMSLIGALLYICFIFIICLKLFIKIIKEKKDTWGIFLLVSYASIAIGSLTIDTFLLTHFWLMSGIIVCYNKKQIN